MNERGESSAPQRQAWAPSDQQQTGQFPQPQWGQGAQYGAPAPSYGQQPPSMPPAPAPAVKPRSKWKTPLIAGVSLVIGLVIGLAAGGSKTNSPSTNAGANSTSSTAPSVAAKAPAAVKSTAPAAPAGPAKSVVLQTSGTGQKTTKTFTVAGDWSVKYTYDCASFGSSGNFIVMEHGNDLDGLPIINTQGNKGGDTTYQHNDGGQRSLEVNSECDWTMTITSGDAG